MHQFVAAEPVLWKH